MSTILKIYTDGACSGNQSDSNLGGWGAILEFGEHKKELYGSALDTTNNKMELTAVIEALKELKRDGLNIEIFTDSSYIANCFREKWYVNWEKNNWKTTKKTAVENRMLWEELLALVRKHTSVTFFRVKGHVNIDNPSTNVDAHYEKFIQRNGNRFTLEDFKYITEMNNLADALANKGIDELRD
ncbi:hypothetical protein AXF21_05425 [Eubacterium minutum ATCC 700079]|nr:hypothetical protein AXF21_05425 [Eubacterium minutum ATCC 700079]